MSVNPIFLSTKIKSFVSDLISDYSYTNYHQLSESDRKSLSGLLMEASGDSECLLESDNYKDVMRAISQCLQVGTQSAKDKMFNAISESVSDYYDNTMRKLFDHVYLDFCEEYPTWTDSIEANHKEHDYYSGRMC